MRSWRTAVALSVVIALAAAIYLIFKYGGLAYAGPTVGAISLVLSVLVLLYSYLSQGRSSNVVDPPTQEQVTKAADWLADAVAGSWRKEAAARRIVTPAPVSVRWRWAGELPLEEAGLPPVAGAGPPPLPAADNSERILSSGVVTRLHDELYKRLPRGRLVITGGPGAGKTGAMILLLLEALARRKQLPLEEQAKVPVPVLLTLAGWDPASVSLAGWAASMLNRDYQALRALRYGSDAASALVDSGRVALFLDGLDEMPDSLRAKALRRIDTEGTGLRIVMTSRPTEYAAAARQVPLGSAAVIELRPVRPAAAARFLLREQPAGNRTEWEKVADYIAANPGSPAARALDNPLTLTMARDAYAAGDPTAITDSSSFPPEGEIAVHLTGQFLARAYPDPRARHWLGCLARHMDSQDGDGSRDLEWWRLGGMLSPVTRILAVALATGVVGTLVEWIIGVPIYLVIPLPGDLPSLSVSARLVISLTGGLSASLPVGFLFGLAYATVLAFGKANSEPAQISLRLRGPRAMARAIRRREHGTRAASGFLGGLVAGIGNGIIVTVGANHLLRIRLSGAERLVVIAGFGTMFGLLAGIAFFLVSVLEESSDTGAAATPLGLLAESRSSALRQAVILAPLTAVVFDMGNWMADIVMGGFPDVDPVPLPFEIAAGVIVGLVGTIAYVLAFTAWGQWLLMARIVLPLTGRLPWRLTTFLDDAYKRGVLRQAGAVYQFRHATLQAYLSREQEAGAGE